jgi:hypothetical protein
VTGWRVRYPALDLRVKEVIHIWHLTRSTKAAKAQQLNAARGLLQRHVTLSEAVQRLSHQFDLSQRQAYRYLEQASHLERPVAIPEVTVPVTLKLPPRTVEVREKKRRKYRSDHSCGIAGVSAHSEKAWLSRVPRPAHFKFTFPILLIACWSRSSCRRPVHNLVCTLETSKQSHTTETFSEPDAIARFGTQSSGESPKR